MIDDEKKLKKLEGEKLSTFIEELEIIIDDFLDDDFNELTDEVYNLLKDEEVEIIFLADDPNYDFILKVKNYEAYLIYDA